MGSILSTLAIAGLAVAGLFLLAVFATSKGKSGAFSGSEARNAARAFISKRGLRVFLLFVSVAVAYNTSGIVSGIFVVAALVLFVLEAKEEKG